MRPRSGVRVPIINFSSVDFPAPFSPRIRKRSPPSIIKDSFLYSSFCPGYRNHKSSTAIGCRAPGRRGDKSIFTFLYTCSRSIRFANIFSSWAARVCPAFFMEWFVGLAALAREIKSDRWLIWRSWAFIFTSRAWRSAASLRLKSA